MSRRKFLCIDCRVDTGRIYEHYFIHTDLWISLVGSNQGMLCITCLEKRLGRILTPDDFTSASINTPNHEPKSALLMNRLGYGEHHVQDPIPRRHSGQGHPGRDHQVSGR